MSTDNVTYFKIASGEQFVAAVTGIDDDTGDLHISRPYTMTKVRQQNGSFSEALVPWPVDEAVLTLQSIAATTTALSKGLRDAYLQAVSGIQIASAVPNLRPVN